MKLPAFSYRPAGSAEEAVALLAEAGTDGAVLAGGQSLLLEMRYGRSHPGVLVDINRAGDLAGVQVADGELRLGALTRHVAVERLELDDPLGRLLTRAAAVVAHPPIRARGTFAGSLAWAHPASVRIGLANAADVPVRAAEAEAALAGSDGSAESVRAAAEAAAGESEPASEPHCSAEYRRHALGVLVRRALTEALAEATPGGEVEAA